MMVERDVVETWQKAALEKHKDVQVARQHLHLEI